MIILTSHLVIINKLIYVNQGGNFLSEDYENALEQQSQRYRIKPLKRLGEEWYKKYIYGPNERHKKVIKI